MSEPLFEEKEQVVVVESSSKFAGQKGHVENRILRAKRGIPYYVYLIMFKNPNDLSFFTEKEIDKVPNTLKFIDD